MRLAWTNVSTRGESVGGKRRIFNFLESAPKKTFPKPLKRRVFPPLTFPKTFKTSPDLVRDQGVGGSNPLSPTNLFNDLRAVSDFPSTPLEMILRLRKPQRSISQLLRQLWDEDDHIVPPDNPKNLYQVSEADGRGCTN